MKVRRSKTEYVCVSERDKGGGGFKVAGVRVECNREWKKVQVQERV